MSRIKATIEEYYNGWSVIIDDKTFTYSHNDVDLGTVTVKAVLEHLNVEVVTEECY